MKRFLRDLTVLLGFCIAFSALLFFAGGLDSDSEPDIKEFSPIRKRADTRMARRDWNGAREDLEKLLAIDPFDGRAQYAYASTFNKERQILHDRLKSLREQGDTGETDQLEQELESITATTRDELIRASQHARYRGRALMFLAVLEADRGDYQAAVEFLDQFASSGNFTPDGLSTYQVFGRGGERMTAPGATSNEETRLHSDPRFWEVVRVEFANRMAN